VNAIEEGLSRGDSTREILFSYLSSSSSGERTPAEIRFREELLAFLRLVEQGSGYDASIAHQTTSYRRSLFLILEAGMRGETILNRIRDLRTEIDDQLDIDVKAHIESLPFRMLAPLLLLMFPAYLILLFGPITRSFLESLE
jgi:hypothetical protein